MSIILNIVLSNVLKIVPCEDQIKVIDGLIFTNPGRMMPLNCNTFAQSLMPN